MDFFVGQLTFVCVQAADHLDDEEEVEDEETALENFTTSVDNEETDEYIAFRTSMQGYCDFSERCLQDFVKVPVREASEFVRV